MADLTFAIHVNKTFRTWNRQHRMRDALASCAGYSPTVRNLPRVQTYAHCAFGLQHCGPVVLRGDRALALRQSIVQWHRWARSQALVSPNAPIAEYAHIATTYIATDENGVLTWYRVTRFHVVPL